MNVHMQLSMSPSAAPTGTPLLTTSLLDSPIISKIMCNVGEGELQMYGKGKIALRVSNNFVDFLGSGGPC